MYNDNLRLVIPGSQLENNILGLAPNSKNWDFWSKIYDTSN